MEQGQGYPEGNAAGEVGSLAYQTPRQLYDSSIIELTSTDRMLEDFELALKSLVRLSDGRFESAGDPLMNPDGINKYMGVARSLVHPTTIMGNTDKLEKVRWLMFNYDAIIQDLMLNWRKYDINENTRSTVRTIITTQLMNLGLSTVNRGLDEGDRRFWKGSTHEITSVIKGQEQGKGFLSKLIGWGK